MKKLKFFLRLVIAKVLENKDVVWFHCVVVDLIKGVVLNKTNGNVREPTQSIQKLERQQIHSCDDFDTYIPIL